MWDVLFAPVPNAFRNQFQTAPLDLPTPAFFPARQEAIKTCLQQIRFVPQLLSSSSLTNRTNNV